MDDLIEALVGTVFGIVIVLAIGAVFGVGWLIYKFCELVLPPFFEWLEEACESGASRLEAWWREVTWKRRALRAQQETLREIDATRRETVARTYALVEALDREQIPTTAGTAAVRVAVRSAVRQG